MNELLQFMHDTMNKTARIDGAINLLKSDLDNGHEFENKLLDIIHSSNKEIIAAIDKFYINNKERYK